MSQNNNLDIITASAGSGKTHILTEEYSSRLGGGIHDVLAITFTNKATAEMKERILGRAAHDKETLREILLHWSDVNISTIDSFVKKACDSIPDKDRHARKVTLDEDDILDRASDRILADTGTAEDLRQRLYNMSRQRLYDGKSWNIKGAVKDIASRYLEEPMMLAMMTLGAGIADTCTIEKAETVARQAQASFLESLALCGHEGLRAMENAGRPAESFKGKSRSPMTIFAKWADGAVKEPPAKLADCLSETDDTGIRESVEKAISLFGEPWREYRNAAVILENVPAMRLYGILGKAIRDTLEEQESEMLKLGAWNLASLLRNHGTELLEEYGVAMPKHILIDEAQDTSALQWENIRMFVEAAMKKGGDALLVGDAKQSIYRWRNSDWRILAEKAEASLPGAKAGHRTLTQNWRSRKAIVDLVNTIFTSAADKLEAMGLTKESAHIRRIYADAAETIPEQRREQTDDGYAAIRFLDPGTWKEEALKKMTEDISSMLSQGYRPGDITILVRRGSEATETARHLQEHGFAVSTDEALKAGACGTVNRAMATLRAIAFPDEPVTRLTAEEIGAATGTKERDTLVETVMAAVADTRREDGDGPYVDALLDAAAQKQKEDLDTLPSFVEWWDAKGCMTPVAAQDNKNAVRVMTIHKSKGLSLEAVIIPFMAEPLTAPTALTPTIWCEAKGKYTDLGVIPVKAYESRLKDTDYEEDCEKERLDQCADTLNIMYVAMTRAKSRLYAYCPDRRGKATFESLLGDILAGTERPAVGTMEYTLGAETPHERDKSDEAKTLDISGSTVNGKPLEKAVLRMAQEEN